MPDFDFIKEPKAKDERGLGLQNAWVENYVSPLLWGQAFDQDPTGQSETIGNPKIWSRNELTSMTDVTGMPNKI